MPCTFFAGLIAGVAGLCLFGRWSAGQKYHDNFSRITPWISPATKYYPTASELANIVRQHAKPGTILVICGGNSVLYGIGQPQERVWTKYLQQELGPRYSVVNLALPGSNIADCGAVIAEVLRKEYPEEIYLSNGWTLGWPMAGGSSTFRFIFWDAYFKGWLIDDPARAAAIARWNGQPADHDDLVEVQVRAWLDRFLYLQDAWNYVTYKKFGTVWGRYPAGSVFLDPRQAYSDPEADFLKIPLSQRFPAYKEAAELAVVRGWAAFAFLPERTPDGKLQPEPGHWNEFRQYLRDALPPELKKRILILVSRNCPYYVGKLSSDEQERDDLACLMTVQQWKEGGYESFDYGKDFPVEDYGDRIHLTSIGGARLAKLAAAQVRAMSRKLGYQNP